MAPSPIADQRIAQVFEYWRAKAGSRVMPARADLDPVDIPALLPNIMLVDVEGPDRFRYRLIGTDCAQAHGVDATGRYLDDVITDAPYRSFVIGLYAECVGKRRPIYSETLFGAKAGHGTGREVRVAFMPLSDDGARVNMVFVAQRVTFADDAMRDRHLLDASPFKEVVHAEL
jgi:hypothetical protein